MKTCIHSALVVIASLIMVSCGTSTKKTTPAELGWEMGAQAYTFRKFTFLQTIDKLQELGLHYVEAYPGQDIGGDMQGKMTYEMSAAYRQNILDYLRQHDVKLMAYGVITPDTKSQWDSLFVFAKEMGIQNITSEPKNDQMSYVSQLCDKYDIDVAIHNHPQPSHYWNPDTLLAAIKGQSSHIGSCADLGHWVRSGLDPLECVKKLSGHIKEIHIKDVASKSPQAVDTVWGTGVIDMKGILEELHRQHFKGLFSIEYESHPENNMPEIRQSLGYFDNLVAKLK